MPGRAAVRRNYEQILATVRARTAVPRLLVILLEILFVFLYVV